MSRVLDYFLVGLASVNCCMVVVWPICHWFVGFVTFLASCSVAGGKAATNA